MKAKEIADYLGVEIQDNTAVSIDKLINSQRLRFDPETEKFTYQLRKPVNLEDGTQIEFLSVTEADGKDMIRVTANAESEPVRALWQMLAAQNNQPTALMERIKQRDLTVLATLLGFFA